jgi:hypothetical protein
MKAYEGMFTVVCTYQKALRELLLQKVLNHRVGTNLYGIGSIN